MHERAELWNEQQGDPKFYSVDEYVTININLLKITVVKVNADV